MTAPVDSTTASSTPTWKRVATIVIPLLILALALHGLANEFDEHGYRAIRQAFRQLSGTQIALTVVLGLASYACLIGFDAIGLRRSGIRVHPARVGITDYAQAALGDVVFVDCPTYFLALRIFADHGVRAVALDGDDDFAQ